MKLEEANGWLIPQHDVPWLNWAFGTRSAEPPHELAAVKQVHGSKVMAVSAPGVAGEADAMFTQTAGLLLGIKTADCLPILFADLRQHAVAAVHAGWRGTAQRIVQESVRAMKKNCETNPIDLLVAMGPAIGPCCFEVGHEVGREFADFDPALKNVTGKCHLDLPAINSWQLEQMGIPPASILRFNICTVCEADRFWSYRREGEKAGRIWSVAGIKKEVPV